MDKKTSSCGTCGSHMACKGCGWIWLVVGILLLLNDWMEWGWNINPVTVVILLFGLHMLCGHKTCCTK